MMAWSFSDGISPAVYAFWRTPRRLHEGDASWKVRTGKLFRENLSPEDADQVPETTLGLGASEGNDGPKLCGEIVNFPFEVAGVLGEEHHGDALGATLADNIH